MIQIQKFYLFVIRIIIYQKKNNKYKNQGFSILTCIFLLKILASSKKIYIDATFKITPKLYYQTLIIISKSPMTNLIIPFFYVPMTSKNLKLHNKIFETVFDILKEENIKYKFDNIDNIYDFELNLRKDIKTNFKIQIQRNFIFIT